MPLSMMYPLMSKRLQGKIRRGRWWEAARFHLCLHPVRVVSPSRRNGLAAGKQVTWLEVGSGKMALSRPSQCSERIPLGRGAVVMK